MVPMERMGLHTKTSKNDDQTKELYSKIRIKSKEQKYNFFLFSKTMLRVFYFRTNNINTKYENKIFSPNWKVFRNEYFVNQLL